LAQASGHRIQAARIITIRAVLMSGGRGAAGTVSHVDIGRMRH
jgi:hypothetical protein